MGTKLNLVRVLTIISKFYQISHQTSPPRPELINTDRILSQMMRYNSNNNNIRKNIDVVSESNNKGNEAVENKADTNNNLPQSSRSKITFI